MENAKAVGVDIQQIRVVSEGVKKRILNEKEWMYFQNEGEQKDVSMKETDVILIEKNRLLNRIWAIKESYVKMTGEGLSHDFRKLCIDFKEGTVTDEKGKQVCYEEVEAPEGYVAAVTMDK
jgi:phosphopantetheinyl transferase